jgi:uncharacterized damage-inducible protein DinB
VRCDYLSNVTTPLHDLFARDLQRLRDAVAAYPDDASLWRTTGAITNPGGTLCLHLCGNLRHFIGHMLGGHPYVRDREREFSTRGLTREELLAELDRARTDVLGTLAALDPAVLARTFPQHLMDREWRTDELLIHLHGHLNYHLGQLNYHRRILCG